MSTSDDEKKTKSQLLAELEEVRRQLEERSAAADADEAPLQPVFAAPMTRRTALSTWVAPVILSIPFGAMARPRTAQGQAPAAPTLMPTGGVPALPTEAPTLRPTRAPTFAAPTLPPTSFPTSFPTAAPAPASAPARAPVLSAAGLGATAAALAGAGAWRLMKKGTEGLDGGDGKPDESDEDSGNEGGSK